MVDLSTQGGFHMKFTVLVATTTSERTILSEASMSTSAD